jgi:hypothetical protein
MYTRAFTGQEHHAQGGSVSLQLWAPVLACRWGSTSAPRSAPVDAQNHHQRVRLRPLPTQPTHLRRVGRRVGRGGGRGLAGGLGGTGGRRRSRVASRGLLIAARGQGLSAAWLDQGRRGGVVLTWVGASVGAAVGSVVGSEVGVCRRHITLNGSVSTRQTDLLARTRTAVG